MATITETVEIIGGETITKSWDDGTGPIIEFQSQEQLDACLSEWQERLFLSDWIIRAKVVKRHEMTLSGCHGENEYQSAIKCCMIRIMELDEDVKDRISKVSDELTLVHEPLHCKFVMTDGAESTVEGNFMGAYEHSLLEQMAKSLIMAKYNIQFSWFKNF